MTTEPIYGYCDYVDVNTNQKCKNIAVYKISQGTKIETKCQQHFDETHMTYKS